MASTATALMATLVATHSSQASAGAAAAPPRPVRQESRPLLALCDAPREHPAPEEISVEQEKTMAEDFAAPVDASQLPDHLDKLRVSAGGNLKRPAAAEPAAEEELPGTGKLAKAKAKSKAKAKASAKGAVLRKPAAADTALLKRPGAAHPARVMKDVPGLTWQERIEMKPNGCSKRRWKRGCTLSCFATYLKQQGLS